MLIPDVEGLAVLYQGPVDSPRRRLGLLLLRSNEKTYEHDAWWLETCWLPRPL